MNKIINWSIFSIVTFTFFLVCFAGLEYRLAQQGNKYQGCTTDAICELTK